MLGEAHLSGNAFRRLSVLGAMVSGGVTQRASSV